MKKQFSSRLIALIAMLCLPLLSLTAFALSAPTNVSVGSLTQTTGTLQWEVTYAAVHDYDIIVSSQQLSTSLLGNATTPCTVTAETPGVVVFVSKAALADVTSYSLTGLTEGTHYFVYIRQNGESQYEDNSGWVSIEFSTPCVATSQLPVSADFDGGNYLPSCWSSGAKLPTFTSTVKHGDAGNSMMLSATSSEACYVYSPVFAGDAHAYYLSAFIYGPVGATYRIGVAETSELLQIENVLEGTITVANAWQPIDATLPAEIQSYLEQGVEYVWVIYNAAADGAKSFYVDDVVIDELPTCVSPSALTASAIGSNAVTLAWNERGNATAWVVEYASAADTLTASVTANPFTLTGLAANTTYTIRIKAACSASDQSAWSQAIVIRTTCGAVSLPYTDNFDSYADGVATSTTRPAAPVYPDCWTVLGEAGNSSDYPQAFITSNSGYNVSGKAFFVKMSSTTPLVAVLPELNIAANTDFIVEFRYRNEGTGSYNGHVQLGYVTDPADAATFTQIEEYAQITSMTAVEEMISLPVGAQVAFRFVGGSNNNYYASVDNVVIKNVPTCLKPKGLRSTTVSAESVTLAWTAGGTETSWELTYKLGQDELQTVVVNTTPEYTITGLDANTNYSLTQLSLRAICSDTDSSEVVTFSNISFKTPCELVELPYTNGFNATPFPGDCWNANYHLAGTAGGWVRTTDANDIYAGAGAAKLQDAQAGNRNVIATPFFHSDAPNTLRVSFWMKRFDNYVKPIEGVRVWVNTVANDTLGGTPIIHVLRNNTQGGTGIMAPAEAAAGWYQYSATIPVAGDVCLLFEGISEYGNYSLIDEVVIEPAPTCDRPTGVRCAAVAADEIKLDIIDRDSLHSAWEVVVGPVGFNPDEATPIAAASKDATIAAPFTLVGQTTYEAYVRTVCSADDKSAWAGPSTFVYTDWSVFAPGITFSSVGQYPWTLGNYVGEFFAASGNVHVVNSVSDLVASVDVPENTKTTVSFDWSTSSYSSYEGFVIYIDEPEPTATNYDPTFGKQAGTSSSGYSAQGSHEVVFTTPGVHTILFRHLYSSAYTTTSGEGISKITAVSRRDVSCVEPSVFNMGTITSTSAVINWNNTGADSWEVALFTSAQTDVNASNALAVQTVTGESTVTIEGLAPNTAYYAYVRSRCGESPSDWSEAVLFRTECAARTVPFSEGFDEVGSELCWKTVGNAVRLSATTAAFDGARAAQVVNDSVAGLLVSPRFDVASLADYEVSLAINLANVRYHGALKPLTIGVMTDPSDVSTYIDLGDIVIPSAGSWKEYRFSLADLATPDYADWADAQYIVVSMSDSATYYIDLVTVAAAASCPKPTALDVQPDGEDVVVTWVSDAAAHYAEIALGDSVVFAGNVQSPFTPTGLAGNTVYKVRVRANCGEENSEWTPWLSFTTPCSYATIPYFEGFESATSASSFPDCWDHYVISGPGTSGFQINTTSGTSNNHTGSKSLKLVDMQSTTYSLAVLPMFYSPRMGGLTLSFWMYRTTGTTHPEEGVRVWVNSVPSLEGATPLMHVTRYGGVAADSLKVAPITTAGWYQFEKVLPINGPCYVMFEGISEYGSSSYIDDIRVDATPTCVKPTGLQLAAFDAESATVAWTPGADETSWQLVYKMGSNAADTVMLSEPNFTVHGLTPSTSYTFNVLSLRAVCSADDASDAISGTLSFKTPCAAEVLPIEENFADGIADCWTRYTSLLFEDGVSTAAAAPATSGWNKSTLVFTAGEVKLNIFGTSCKSWIVTPAFRVNDAQATLAFDIALTLYNKTLPVTAGSQADDKFIVAVSTDGSTWHTADATVWSNAEGAAHVYDSISTTGDHYELPLAAYVGQTIRVAFYGESTVSGGDNDFHLSNIVISEPADCDRPSALEVDNIEQSGATVYITDEAGSAWEYVINDVEAAPVRVTAPSFTVTGLSAQTTYTVYVRRVCGAGNVSAWRSVTFMTACGVIDAPYVEDFEDWTAISGCWHQEQTVAATSTSGTDYGDNCWKLNTSSSSTSAHTSSKSLQLQDTRNGTHTILVLPAVHSNAANALEFSFWMYRTTGTSKQDEGVKVWVNNAPNLTGATPLMHVTRCGGVAADDLKVAPITASGWYEYSTPLPMAGDIYVILEGISEWGSSSYIDDVKITVAPTCRKPADLLFREATSTTVKMQIEDADDADAWEYAVNDTVNPIAVADTIFTIAGLTPDSDLTIYLRRVCSETDKSEWISADAFTTSDPVEAVYEDLDGDAALEGWYALARTSTSYPTYNNAYGVDGSKALYFYAYSSSPYSAIFALPEVTGNITGYQFLADIKKSTATSAGDILIGVADALGAQITYVDSITPNSASFETYKMDFSSYTGTGKFPILYVRNLQTTAYVDNIVLEPIPTCERPQAVAVLGSTAATVDVLITDTASAHEAWEVVVVAKNAAPSTGTPVLVTDKAVTVEGAFVSGTPYDVYVRAVCSDVDKSQFRGPATFKYIDYSTFGPSDATITSPTEYVWDLVADGADVKAVSTNSGVINKPCDMVLTITVPEGTETVLSFNYSVSSYNTASYGALYVYDNEAEPSTTNYFKQYLGGAYADGYFNQGQERIKLYEGTHVIRFRYYKTTSYSYGDDCAKVWNIATSTSRFFAPENIALTDLEANTATLAWGAVADADSYQVRLRSTDVDTIVNVAETQVVLADLTANTMYRVVVRACNPTDTTAWTSAFIFSTPCDVMNLPYAEDFESYSGAPTSSYTTTSPVTPDCWNLLGSGSMISVMTSSTYASSGTKALIFAGNSSMIAMLPTFNADGQDVRFYATYRTESSTSTGNGTFQFGYLTVPGDASSFVALQNGPLTTTRTRVMMVIPAAATVTPAIKYVAGTASNWYAAVDDITVEVVPTCEKPESVSFINLTASQVDVLISDADTAHHAWQVAFGARGFNPDADDALIVDTDSKIVSLTPAAPLVADSTYNVYARTVCAVGETSPWTAVAAAKYFDFSAVSDVNLNLNEGSYPWEMVTDAGIRKMQSTNQGRSSTTSDLSTAVVVAEGEHGYLSFNYYASGEGTSTPIDYLCVYVDETSPSTSNYRKDFALSGKAGLTSGTSGTYTIALTPGNHTIRWRFYKDSSLDGGEDMAQVWNIRYFATTAWAPDSIRLADVTPTTATLAWQSCPDAVKNEVRLENQTLETAVDSIVLTGLVPNTLYDVQIRSILAEDTTMWSDFSFRTECDVFTLPLAESFEDGTWRNCWTNEHVAGTSTNIWSKSSSYVADGDSSIYCYLSTGNQVLLATPQFAVAEGESVRLSFSLNHSTGSSYPNETMAITVEGNTVQTLTTLGYRAPNEPVKTGTNTYEYVWDVLADDNVSVHFLTTGQSGYSWYLDDVRIARIAKADTIFDGTCSGSDYEGYGFSIPASQLNAGYNTFEYTKRAVSDLESDTIFTLKLFVSQPSLQEFRDTTCAHSHYTGYGFDIADVDPLRTTPYVRHLENQFGCDSTVSLTLFVPQTEFAQTVHLCEGDSYVFGDSTITTSGVYVRTYENQYGCDSTITLQIFFHGVASAVEASICPGDAYTFNGRQLTDAGTYTATFQNAAGCDSVVTLTLTLTQPVVTHIDGVFCEGTTFAGGSISPKFMDLTAAGTYTDTLVSVLTGCDSILVLDLVEEKIQRTTVNGTYSDGKPFVYDGQSYQEAGTFEIIKSTVNGCDSIITLVVTKETGFDNLQLGELSVSPNPVQVGEEAVINTEIIFSADYVLRVYDAVGRLVTETRDANGRVPAMPVAGVYTVRITADNHSYQSKLIVK